MTGLVLKNWDLNGQIWLQPASIFAMFLSSLTMVILYFLSMVPNYDQKIWQNKIKYSVSFKALQKFCFNK